MMIAEDMTVAAGPTTDRIRETGLEVHAIREMVGDSDAHALIFARKCAGSVRKG
jgi:hypothetical protein